MLNNVFEISLCSKSKMGEKKKNKLTNKLEGRLQQETSLNQFKVNSENFNILGKRFRTAIKLTPNCPWGMEAFQVSPISAAVLNTLRLK